MTDVSTKATSIARIATPKARGYMIQLCKHFSHKVEATYTDTTGRIAFGERVCELDSSQPDVLAITLHAENDAGLHAIEDVVARHLVRFAFKEDLAIQWVGHA